MKTTLSKSIIPFLWKQKKLQFLFRLKIVQAIVMMLLFIVSIIAAYILINTGSN